VADKQEAAELDLLLMDDQQLHAARSGAAVPQSNGVCVRHIRL
jgi:hypothetical protein